MEPQLATSSPQSTPALPSSEELQAALFAPPDPPPLPPAVASICFSCPQIFPESHRHMDWLLVEKMCPRERAFACAARLIAPVLFVF